MSHDCGHETYSGTCRKCKGDGTLPPVGALWACPVCPDCNGTGECRSCTEAFAEEDVSRFRCYTCYRGSETEREHVGHRCNRVSAWVIGKWRRIKYLLGVRKGEPR